MHFTDKLITIRLYEKIYKCFINPEFLFISNISDFLDAVFFKLTNQYIIEYSTSRNLYAISLKTINDNSNLCNYICFNLMTYKLLRSIELFVYYEGSRFSCSHAPPRTKDINRSYRLCQQKIKETVQRSEPAETLWMQLIATLTSPKRISRRPSVSNAPGSVSSGICRSLLRSWRCFILRDCFMSVVPMFTAAARSLSVYTSSCRRASASCWRHFLLDFCILISESMTVASDLSFSFLSLLFPLSWALPPLAAFECLLEYPSLLGSSNSSGSCFELEPTSTCT